MLSHVVDWLRAVIGELRRQVRAALLRMCKRVRTDVTRIIDCSSLSPVYRRRKNLAVAFLRCTRSCNTRLESL